jgi:hypothetical protein
LDIVGVMRGLIVQHKAARPNVDHLRVRNELPQ